MAIDADVPVQKIDYPKLKEKLLEDKQVLAWTAPKGTTKAAAAGAALDPAGLPGIVVDNAQAKLKGEWSPGVGNAAHVGPGYQHDGDEGKGSKTARFVIPVKSAGDYEVRFAYSALGNRAPAVPVTVSGFAGSVSKVVVVNEQKPPPIDGHFISLGTFHFEAGAEAVVEVSNEGTKGHVIIDAVQLLPAGK